MHDNNWLCYVSSNTTTSKQHQNTTSVYVLFLEPSIKHPRKPVVDILSFCHFRFRICFLNRFFQRILLRFKILLRKGRGNNNLSNLVCNLFSVDCVAFFGFCCDDAIIFVKSPWSFFDGFCCVFWILLRKMRICYLSNYLLSSLSVYFSKDFAAFLEFVAVK